MIHKQSKLRNFRNYSNNYCLFITTNIIDKKPLLNSRDAAYIIINSIIWLNENNRLLLGGFVIMPDHIHFIASLTNDFKIPQIMHSLKSYTSNKINLFLTRKGCLWQEQYWDHIIRDFEDYKVKLEYMHNNPVRRGLVANPGDYPYSTANQELQKHINRSLFSF